MRCEGRKKGCFSMHNLNPDYKYRLEKFIKRNKSPEQGKSASRSPKNKNSPNRVDKYTIGDRLAASPIIKNERTFKCKVEALVSGEAKLDQVIAKTLKKLKGAKEREKKLVKFLEESNREFACLKREKTEKICKEIVLGTLSLVFTDKRLGNMSIDAKDKALQVSEDKLKKLEKKLKETKKKIDEKKSIFWEMKKEKTEKMREKKAEIKSLSRCLENFSVQTAENLENRESYLLNLSSQIALLEKQVESHPANLSKKLEFERFKLMKKSLKEKELALADRQKKLEDSKTLILEIKSKIKWRLNNISSAERRASRDKTSSKKQELEFFIKSEEMKLNAAKERVEAKEINIKALKSKLDFLQSKPQLSFAETFQMRQEKLRQEFSNLSKEKKTLSDQLTSLLNF